MRILKDGDAPIEDGADTTDRIEQGAVNIWLVHALLMRLLD